jgi:hypothetical protein
LQRRNIDVERPPRDESQQAQGLIIENNLPSYFDHHPSTHETSATSTTMPISAPRSMVLGKVVARYKGANINRTNCSTSIINNGGQMEIGNIKLGVEAQGGAKVSQTNGQSRIENGEGRQIIEEFDDRLELQTGEEINETNEKLIIINK